MYRHIDEIRLKIMSVENEPLVHIGNPGTEMGDNDLLLLKLVYSKVWYLSVKTTSRCYIQTGKSLSTYRRLTKRAV